MEADVAADKSFFSERLVRAFARRQGLAEGTGDTDTYRLFHGWGEGCPGIEIDRYGDFSLVRIRDPFVGDPAAIVGAFAECCDISTIIVKKRQQAPYAFRGAIPDQSIVVHEAGMRFGVQLWRERNPGLYLDARPVRAWIRKHSRDRRVLNLFSFTGSLGIAAAIGGAKVVTHVDSQRGALARCKANYALNSLSIDDRDLARLRIYHHIPKAASSGRTYDAVIIDAPPLSSHRSDHSPGGRGVLALAPHVARMLSPGGWMLCFFHHSELSHDEHEKQIIGAASATELEVFWRGTSGMDFPEERACYKLRVTAFQRRGGQPL